MFLIVVMILQIRISVRLKMLEHLLTVHRFRSEKPILPNGNPSVQLEGEVQEVANPEKHSPENYVPKSSPSTPKKSLLQLLKEDDPKTIVELLKEEYDEEK